MKKRVVVIGASGLVGQAACAALREHNEVIAASRTGEHRVDLHEPESIAELLRSLGPVDAVVSCTGVVAFKPLAELSEQDYQDGFADKVMGQVNLVRAAAPVINDGGSITLTSGILAREPIATGALASLTNGALESFVMAAATELGRGLRINAVSPSVLKDASSYHEFFPGFAQATAEQLGQAYVKSVDGVQTGQVYRVPC